MRWVWGRKPGLLRPRSLTTPLTAHDFSLAAGWVQAREGFSHLDREAEWKVLISEVREGGSGEVTWCSMNALASDRP